MKFSVKQSNGGFCPVTLTLTFETQAELDDFVRVWNDVPDKGTLEAWEELRTFTS